MVFLRSSFVVSWLRRATGDSYERRNVVCDGIRTRDGCCLYVAARPVVRGTTNFATDTDLLDGHCVASAHRHRSGLSAYVFPY